MKITANNLGVITHSEIEIKPLTLFIGPNNTGKTWLAYTLMSIFSSYGWEKYLDHYLDNKTREKYPELDKALDTAINEGAAKIDFLEFSQTYCERYFNDVAQLAPLWIDKFLFSKRCNFKNLDVKIDLSNDINRISDKVLALEVDENLSLGKVKQKNKFQLFKEKNDRYIYFYTEGHLLDNLPISKVKDFLYTYIFAHMCFKVKIWYYVYPLMLNLPINQTVKDRS